MEVKSLLLIVVKSVWVSLGTRGAHLVRSRLLLEWKARLVPCKHHPPLLMRRQQTSGCSFTLKIYHLHFINRASVSQKNKNMYV